MSASISSALRPPRTGYRVKSRNRIRIFLVCQFDRSQRHTCNMNLQQNIKLSTFSINIIFSTLIAADTVRHQLAAADFISAVWLCNFCCPLHVRCGDVTSRVCVCMSECVPSRRCARVFDWLFFRFTFLPLLIDFAFSFTPPNCCKCFAIQNVTLYVTDERIMPIPTCGYEVNCVTE